MKPSCIVTIMLRPTGGSWLKGKGHGLTAMVHFRLLQGDEAGWYATMWTRWARQNPVTFGPYTRRRDAVRGINSYLKALHSPFRFCV